MRRIRRMKKDKNYEKVEKERKVVAYICKYN